MATNAPNTNCSFCGQPHEYEVERVYRPRGAPLLFGPTPWIRKSHTCPPGAFEKWFSEHLSVGPREPFFTVINPKETTKMSWSYSVAGRASKLAEVVKDQFVAVQGCPKGTAEEEAKNALGEVAETLCKSFAGDKVVRIEASGSAWNEGGKANSQSASFKFETLSGFVE